MTIENQSAVLEAAQDPANIEALYWPDPESIPDTLAPVPPMVAELIPEPFRAWLADVADRMQCPLDFPAIGAVVGAASLVGTSIRIRPKRCDDWTVTPNLWGALIGDPSSGKSPSLSESLAPLQRLERLAKESHEQESKAYEFSTMEAKAKADALRDKLRKAAKAGQDTESLRLEYLAEEEAETPARRRHIANDSTVEALGILLNQNPRGTLVFRDELTGWLRSLDKPGHETDRAFYLEAWNGSGRFTYDRIGRGTLDIESACISIIGGIQPGPLRGYLDAVKDGGFGNDGLLQRFQLMVFPDPLEARRIVDRPPNIEARNRAHKVFEALAKLEPGLVAARDGETGPHFLRFDEEAYELFFEWLTDNLQRSLELGSSVMGSHLTKYQKLMPSLALIFHLVDVADGKPVGPGVSLEAAELAAAWCSYLEAHAVRVYGLGSDGELARARELIRHVKRGDLASPFTARDLLRKGWHLLGEPDHVQKALEVAEEYGWLRGERREGKPDGGRRTVDYHINPKAAKGGAA